MRRLSLVLVCSLLLTLLAGVPASYGQQVTITVDRTAEIGEINPFVYGANYGPWALVAVDVLEDAANAGITHLRFPAGNWGDQNNITPQQLDFFMMQAQLWGAEPSIHVRLEGGTPEQAAELVRYANLEKGYNIRHWAIGNEPDLFDDYSVEQLNEEWREIALAMLEVDPDILLIGPEVSQFPPTIEGDPYNNERREMVRGFLEANGDLVDIVSIHRYPFPRERMGEATSAEDLRLNVLEWDTLVENVRTVMLETLGTELPIAITEVNSHWSNGGGAEGSPDSYYHAIWWSDVLGRLIKQRVAIVDYFNLYSTGSLGAFGLLNRYEPSPTYYTYQLYKELGQMLVESTSTDDYISSVAAQRADGALTLLIHNLYQDEQVVTLSLGSDNALQIIEARLLSPEIMAEPVDPATLLTGDQLTLPGQSAVLLIYRQSED